MALLNAYNKIASDLDKGFHTMGIFLDLSKAFDTIDHRILLTKLHHYGVRGSAFEWFKSYLSDRTQYVCYNEYYSSHRQIHCGVPQGSVLGPLLFIIFLNDIAFSSDKFSFVTYADDTNVIVSHANLHDLITTVNHELDKLSVWFKANKLSLNIDKSNYIMFKNRHSNRVYNDMNICIDGLKISRVSCTKFLGVLLDECLTWSKHTTNVTNTLSKYCGILYRLKDILPQKTLFSLYNTLVLPHLTYCNLIWADSNNSNLNSIHIKQKRIMRICSNSHWLEHTPPLFKNFNTLTIYDIHNLTLGSFMYNFVSNNLPNVFNDYFTFTSSIHNYPTSSSQLLRPYHFNTDLARNTIRRQGAVIWNTVKKELRNSVSLHAFKRKYKLYLLSYYH